MPYFYESHLGGFYTDDEDLDYDVLYCDECGDSDMPLGYADSAREAWGLLRDYADFGDGGYLVTYVFPTMMAAATPEEGGVARSILGDWTVEDGVCTSPEALVWEALRAIVGDDGLRPRRPDGDIGDDEEAPMIVTIDGPSASGKSTVARLVSEMRGIPRLDTGAMYRAVTWLCLRRGADVSDARACGEVARSCEVVQDSLQVVVRDDVTGESWDVTEKIRTPEIDHAVSAVSAHASVREVMTCFQRAAAGPDGIVADGRDMGTVVFPDADVKVFLTASARARAERRAAERGDTDIERTLAEIERRDELDSSRDVAPLRPADDAVVIDTSGISATDVAWIVADLIDKAH